MVVLLMVVLNRPRRQLKRCFVQTMPPPKKLMILISNDSKLYLVFNVLETPLKSLNIFWTVLEPFLNVKQGCLDVDRTIIIQFVLVQDIKSGWSEGV